MQIKNLNANSNNHHGLEQYKIQVVFSTGHILYIKLLTPCPYSLLLKKLCQICLEFVIM